MDKDVKPTDDAFDDGGQQERATVFSTHGADGRDDKRSRDRHGDALAHSFAGRHVGTGRHSRTAPVEECGHPSRRNPCPRSDAVWGADGVQQQLGIKVKQVRRLPKLDSARASLEGYLGM